MEQKILQQAQKAFSTLCQMLENRDWNYEKDEEKLCIDYGVRGDDLPMDFRIVIDPERMLALLYCPFQFSMNKEHITEGAIAVCMINDSIIDGNFDLDVENGRLCYRMSLCYRESLLSEDAFYYLLAYAMTVVDEYNDKLLMISKGMMSLEQLKESM